jgi:hypothetical protein
VLSIAYVVNNALNNALAFRRGVRAVATKQLFNVLAAG